MFLRNTTPKTKRRWKAVVTQKPKSRRAPYNSKHPQQKHENSTNHSPSALWSKSTTERLKLAVCRYSIRSFPLFFFFKSMSRYSRSLFSLISFVESMPRSPRFCHHVRRQNILRRLKTHDGSNAVGREVRSSSL